MQHLIPSLQENLQAADDLRQGRWPDGVTWPRCGSDAGESRERCDHGRQRFHWVPGAARWGQPCAMCTDWTRAIFEARKWRPLAGLLGIGVWPWKLHAPAMAAAAASQERTAPRGLTLLDGGLDATSHRDPTRPLAHQGAADACSQSAGSPGLPRAGERCDRAPRPRGRPLRGRAPAETGRPPLLGVGQRRDQADEDAPAAHVSLEVREHVRTATIKPLMVAKGKGGAQFCTDAYHISHCTKVDYDHRTVNHGAGEDARRDPDGAWVHWNTMAGVWSGLRNVLDRFKGSSQRFLHLRVVRDEFLHNQGHLHWRQTFEAALRSIFSTPGDYLRRMAHQHRRMPLTLCYR